MADYAESRGNFAAILHWHLVNGTRPSSDRKQGVEWGSQEFAGAIKAGITDKAVRNWRTGRNTPRVLDHIERALFGENPSGSQRILREDLRQAHSLTKNSSAQKTDDSRTPGATKNAYEKLKALDTAPSAKDVMDIAQYYVLWDSARSTGIFQPYQN